MAEKIPADRKQPALAQAAYAAGKYESLAYEVDAAAVEVKSTAARVSWPDTKENVLTLRQVVSRDGGKTWESFGSATFQGGARDIHGNPVSECYVVGRTRAWNPETRRLEIVPLGPGVLVKTEMETLRPLTTKLDMEAPTRPTPNLGLQVR